MKNFTLLALVLYAAANYAQTPDNSIERIAEAEMKSAFRSTNSIANINTANYDIVSHELHFTVNPSQYFITGVVTTAFTAKENMSTVTFELTNQLTVSSVTRDGNNLAFVQNDDNELVITLPATQPEGVTDDVTINYSGLPGFTDEPFMLAEHNGSPILTTQSEPYGAMEWWPCKNDLNDKIETLDVYITAPSQYVSVSNGLEQSQTINGNGTKTSHFHHGYPIPAYLVGIAVTNYSVFTQQAGTAPNTFPIVNYVYPEDLSWAQSQLAATPGYIEIFEELFDTYPFHEEKYGHAQWHLGGGMEHSTVSFVGGFGRELISHELGHQWFGDKVTCGSWKDIWLNEGFATYLSGIVVEHQDGNDNFTEWKDLRSQSVTSFPDGSVYLTDNDTTNVGRIFSSRLTYNKGAMVLHMLRFKLGDDDFFQGVRNYLADPELAYGYAKTPDLQDHLETVSGVDLDEFFSDWVYNQGYPTYDITVHPWGPGNVQVVINQTQSHSSVSYFEMPVPIRLIGPLGQTQDVVLQNTFSGQEFIVPTTFPLSDVIFDPNKDIISAWNTVALAADDFNLLSAVRLYPNPANDRLNLETPEGLDIEKTTFYNILGQKVLETGTEASWDVSRLATGMHFISLQTNQGSRQLKFIKE